MLSEHATRKLYFQSIHYISCSYITTIQTNGGPSHHRVKGKYNQVALEALDGVMAAAADNDIRVTLVLARNWDGPDNKAAVCRLMLQSFVPLCPMYRCRAMG